MERPFLKDGKTFDAGFAPAKAISSMIYLAFFTLCFDIILIIGSYLEDITNRKRFLQRILMVRQQDEIIRAKTQNERVQKDFLEGILPSNLVDGLQKQQSIHSSVRSLCHSHMGVSMLYADLVGFTAFSAQVDPFKVMVFLNDLFQVFDGLCDDFNVYKIETVGDCYVATVGVATGEMVTEQVRADAPDSSSDLAASLLAKDSASNASASASNATNLIGFAKAMVLGSRQVMKPVVGTPATLRVGIHSGSCISGIVGTRNIKYCLLGSDVVTAALMEHLGVPDNIHASQEIVDLLPGEDWVKSKTIENREGDKVVTYILKSL